VNSKPQQLESRRTGRENFNHLVREGRRRVPTLQCKFERLAIQTYSN
jgi:hypothetical protein